MWALPRWRGVVSTSLCSRSWSRSTVPTSSLGSGQSRAPSLCSVLRHADARCEWLGEQAQRVPTSVSTGDLVRPEWGRAGRSESGGISIRLPVRSGWPFPLWAPYHAGWLVAARPWRAPGWDLPFLVHQDLGTVRSVVTCRQHLGFAGDEAGAPVAEAAVLPSDFGPAESRRICIFPSPGHWFRVTCQGKRC